MSADLRLARITSHIMQSSIKPSPTAAVAAPAPKAKLSTHVLDLSAGKPAANMRIDLRSITTSADGTETCTHISTVTTNSDGRTDAPVLDAASMRIGEFELVFHVRPYFEARGQQSPFLNKVPLFFFFNAPSHYLL
jgi:5-hydroxyisourate hydrolase